MVLAREDWFEEVCAALVFGEADMQNFWELLVITGIQPDHFRSTFSNFEDRYTKGFYKTLMQIKEDVLAEKLRKNFVFLCGSSGCGKTHFLVSLFRAKVAVDKGVMGADRALYIQFPLLVQEIIAGFDKVKSTRIGLLKYLEAKWLFLDDLSKAERVVDEGRIEYQIFKDTLLDRFENRRYLLMSSNYTSIELRRLIKSVYGEYMFSRVDNNCLWVDFPKADFRKGST